MTRALAVHALGDAGRAVYRRSGLAVRKRLVTADDIDRVTCRACRTVLLEARAHRAWRPTESAR